MPELPEVETVVQGLKSRIIGLEVKKVIFLSPHLEKKHPEETRIINYFVGQRISGVRRRGKMIIVEFDGRLNWLIHLKMTGQLFFADKNRPLDKHVHVRVLFKGLAQELRFRDVRKFGFWFCLEGPELEKRISASLGPEPLELNYRDFARLWQRYPSRQVKSLLLDQKIIAGLGNIYSDEILFRAGVKPDRRLHSLTEEEGRKIYRAIKRVLREAIAMRGSSVSDYVDSDGERGHFQEKHQVYGRAGSICWRCKTGLIQQKKIAGRSSCFCPVCQK